MPFSDIELNDGHRVPAIAFGTGSANKGKDVHHYIEQAIEAGFSHLDTAQYYRNEASVGRAIRESGLSREHLYITTKWSLGSVQDAIAKSLSNLGLKYVDLYLIHGPYVVQGDFEYAWRQLENIKAEGLARSVGVSNFKIEDLQILLKTAKVKPAVNQISLNPYNYKETKPLLDFHALHGIVTEAYGSLAPITTYPGGPLDPVLQKIAARRGIVPSQVIFLWVRAKKGVIVTTTSKKERLLEYLAVGDLDNLTQQDVAEIDAAGAEFAQLALHPWLVLLAQVAIIIVLICFIGSRLYPPT